MSVLAARCRITLIKRKTFGQTASPIMRKSIRFKTQILLLRAGLPLLALGTAGANTVVHSTFVGGFGFYSDPKNWSPQQVPNNTASTAYTVTATSSDFLGIEFDLDATISSLDFSRMGNSSLIDHSLTVTGSSVFESGPKITGAPNFNILSVKTAAVASLGNLTNFSGGTLSHVSLGVGDNSSNGIHPATIRFNGAHIVALQDADVSFFGPASHLTDENGNDALRDLAQVDINSSLTFDKSHNFVTAGNFTNNGSLNLGGDMLGVSFTVKGSLTNFDRSTHTLSGGSYKLSETYTPVPTTLRFNQADIVNNASSISLRGPDANLLDENGLDGLRHLAHNLTNGSLTLKDHPFTTSGNFTNDGILDFSMLSNAGQFTVSGSLTNFDPATKTLTGGTFSLGGGKPLATLRFPGADIVHNAARLEIATNAAITDLNGADALRNLQDNTKAGTVFLTDYKISPSGNFSNAGTISMNPGELDLLPGHTYTQTFGSIEFLRSFGEPLLTADTVSIQGGLVTGGGTIKGNVTIGAGTIASALVFLTSDPNVTSLQPEYFKINGNLTLSKNAHLKIAIAGTFQDLGNDLTDYDFVSVSGNALLGGTLDVANVDKFVPANSDTFTILTAGTPLKGAFSNVPSGSRLMTSDGSGSYQVTYNSKNLVLSGFQPAPAVPSRLLNISTRMRVLTGEQVLIAGFIITGNDPKKVIIRGIGPSLNGVGVTLADPTLELHHGSTTVATNDNWKTRPDGTSQQAEIEATTIPPKNDLESAIVATLNPGAYTAILAGRNGGTGVGLVEVYDLAQGANSKLANISTRGFVDTGNNVMIGGLIVGGGTGGGTAKVIARALGPSVPVAGALADPILELHNGSGTTIASNDNWKTRPDGSSQQAEIEATTIPPTKDLESALVATLAPGSYTAIVRGKNNTTGVGLVEVYNLQ
jgi:hypothetical protein